MHPDAKHTHVKSGRNFEHVVTKVISNLTGFLCIGRKLFKGNLIHSARTMQREPPFPLRHKYAFVQVGWKSRRSGRIFRQSNLAHNALFQKAPLNNGPPDHRLGGIIDYHP